MDTVINTVMGIELCSARQHSDCSHALCILRLHNNHVLCMNRDIHTVNVSFAEYTQVRWSATKNKG